MTNIKKSIPFPLGERVGFKPLNEARKIRYYSKDLTVRSKDSI